MTMDTELIGTLGFPIFMCIYLLYERNQSMKDLRQTIQDLHILIAEKL